MTGAMRAECLLALCEAFESTCDEFDRILALEAELYPVLFPKKDTNGPE